MNDGPLLRAASGAVPAPSPANEAQRLAALQESRVLDTEAEQTFDDLTTLASAICGTPIALVSLVDSHRQWFKSRVGLDAAETPRELAFCGHAILSPGDVFEIPDTRLDARFSTNPLVMGDPLIRFYAGAPIVSAEGLPLGTLCVIDRRPRDLTVAQRDALQALARTAGALLRARREDAVRGERIARLTEVFEQTQAGLAISDTQGRLTRVNNRFAEILGYSADELMNRKVRELTHPEDWPRNQDLYLRVLRTGEPFTLEKRYLRSDGGIAWTRNQVSGIVDEEGDIVSVVAAVEDITEQKRLEGRMRESEDRFIRVAQSVALKLWITDLTHACTFINKQWCEYVGQPMESQLGMRWLSAMHPEDAPRLEAYFLANADSQTEFSADYRLRRHDGVYRWQHSTAHPRRGEEGEFLGYVGTVVDIHDQRMAAEKLEREVVQRTSELAGKTTLLNTVVDALPSGVLALDAKEQLLVYNPAMALITGCTADQVPADCNDWAVALAIRDPVTGASLEGNSLPLVLALKGQTVHRRELLFTHHRNGDERYAEVSTKPIRAFDSSVAGAVLVMTDVTDRKHAAQALMDSESRFRMISDVTPQILWTASAEGSIEFVNSSGLAYFGLPLEKLVGPGWLNTLHPDDVKRTVAAWQHSIATGESVELQYRFRRYDGEYRWQITRGVAQFDEHGNIARWYGVSTDIEDLKRAQAAAEAATEAKSQFLANMSHEIRTPMNGVIGMTTLLQSTDLDETQLDFVNTIRSSGEHLLALINDILDFSRAEAGKLELEHYAFDLRGCMQEAMDLVSSTAGEKLLRLRLDVAQDLPRRISGDAGRLRQVLVNLLANAIKFSEAGEIVVHARVERAAVHDSGWRLHFSVQDSGIGIPADRMHRLFGVFSQVDASHTRTHGGSGLGLAICKRLVERMGGSIGVDSTEGVGSTFWFEIEAGTAPVEAVLANRDFTGKRALVVDDNSTNRRMLRLMLESWGFDVSEAAAPAEALHVSQQQRFDVALLDFTMPQMTGVELARTLREDATTQGLPMLLLGSTGEEAEALHEQLFAARMLKPIRQSTLFDQLAILFGSGATGLNDAGLGSQLASAIPLRILVAEDNIVNQKVALRFLEKMGYSADLVANGREALEAVLRQTYDVVLMDVQMPEMDGFEATREIRRQLKSGPRIVAVTANALAGDEQRCREAGMDDYISKPIDPLELVAVLRRSARGHDVQASPLKSVSAEKIVAGHSAASAEDYRADMLAKLEEVFEADGARELIDTMQADLPRQLAEFERAVGARDAVSAGRVVHSLKSTVHMLGAKELGGALQALELKFRDAAALDEAARAMPPLALRCRELIGRLYGSLKR